MNSDRKQMLAQAEDVISEENEIAAEDLWRQHNMEAEEKWTDIPTTVRALWRYTVLRQPFLPPRPQ